MMTHYISDMNLYQANGYYVVEWLLVSEDFTTSKHQTYRAKKYQTFVDKVNELLKEYKIV